MKLEELRAKLRGEASKRLLCGTAYCYANSTNNYSCMIVNACGMAELGEDNAMKSLCRSQLRHQGAGGAFNAGLVDNSFFAKAAGIAQDTPK